MCVCACVCGSALCGRKQRCYSSKLLPGMFYLHAVIFPFGKSKLTFGTLGLPSKLHITEMLCWY